MKEERIYLPKLQGDRCFACGGVNPIGLKLDFYRLGNTICTDILLGRHYEGWSNMAHGGIISTLLEETMSWAVLFFKRNFFTCRGINIKYIRPVLVGEDIRVSAKLSEQSAFSEIKVLGEIRDSKKVLLVRGSGDFQAVPLEEISFTDKAKRAEIRLLFDQFPPL